MEMPSQQVYIKSWITVSDIKVYFAAIDEGPHWQTAWRELVRRFGPAVGRAIQGVLHRHRIPLDGGLVEDLVESTWFRACRRKCNKLRTWNPERSGLGAYLVTIGMGEALTWCRYIARRKEILLDHQEMQRLADQPDGHLSPEQSAWLKEAEELVQDWEARLGPPERDLLRLWREGMEQVAIGRALGRSQAFVSNVLKRLKEELERLLEGLRM